MSGFTDTLRGDGLVKVHRALCELEADPERLDRARRRFDRSPPPYKSSGTPTVWGSPEFSSGEKREQLRRLEKFRRRLQLMEERVASFPLEQFTAQTNDEKRRIWNAYPRNGWMSEGRYPLGDFEGAVETVKKRWVEQGIWKDKWDEMVAGRYLGIGPWKHEEPLELESESETDTEAESLPLSFSIFGVPRGQPQSKPRRPKSDDEKRQIAERRAVREREREASRPYYQFVYQMSKERVRIQHESADGEGANNADINTRAYENVRDTWTKRKIWDGRWGIMPGMSWKHEEPLEEEAADSPAPISANPLVNGSHEAGDVGSARSENGDAVRSRSASNSPRSRMGQASRPRGEKRSHKDEQSWPVASASLSPAHSSEVSKATGKESPGPQRQPNASQEVSSVDPPLLSGPDIAEPLPQTSSIPPRRSKRLQPPEPSRAKGSTAIASTDPSERMARSRPAGSLVSAISQGIPKKQRLSRTRVETREDSS